MSFSGVYYSNDIHFLKSNEYEYEYYSFFENGRIRIRIIFVFEKWTNTNTNIIRIIFEYRIIRLFTDPHGEEGPGHVRKLPQDVGSTRLVPSSTLRKRKKSDQESNKVDEMRERRKIQKRSEYRKNYWKDYYEMNKEEILKKIKKYRLKIKEKRKEVSCNILFDIINYLFVLTYLNLEHSGCQF